MSDISKELLSLTMLLPKLVLPLALLVLICSGLVSPPAFVRNTRFMRRVNLSVSPHKGDSDMLGGIDGDPIMKEQRSLELRDKIAKLQAMRRKGVNLCSLEEGYVCRISYRTTVVPLHDLVPTTMYRR